MRSVCRQVADTTDTEGLASDQEEELIRLLSIENLRDLRGDVSLH